MFARYFFFKRICYIHISRALLEWADNRSRKSFCFENWTKVPICCTDSSCLYGILLCVR